MIEYYFGDDFLVAPVMNSENMRDVYLPEGEWINFFTGEAVSGNRWLNNLQIPLDEMPVWVKKGARISVYPHHVSSTDEIDLAKTEKLVFDDSYSGVGNSVLSELWK